MLNFLNKLAAVLADLINVLVQRIGHLPQFRELLRDAGLSVRELGLARRRTSDKVFKLIETDTEDVLSLAQVLRCVVMR